LTLCPGRQTRRHRTRHSVLFDKTLEHPASLTRVRDLVTRAALEKNTRLRYNSVQDAFVRCHQRCFPGRPIFPITFESLSTFECASLSAGYEWSSVVVRRSAVKRLTVGKSQAFLPTDQDRFLFKDWSRGARKFCEKEPEAKLAFRRRHLQEAFEHPRSPFKGARYDSSAAVIWLMANVQHQGMLRTKELLNLKVGDLRFVGHGSACILQVLQSKCNKTLVPEHVVFVGDEEVPQFSVPTMMQQVLRTRYGANWGRHADEPLFADPYGKKAFTYPQWVAHVRWIASWTSLNADHRAVSSVGVKLVAGHSFRAGGASDALQGGMPLHLVMAQGRWRSEQSLYWYNRFSLEDRIKEVRLLHTQWARRTVDGG
jgi:integrase